MKLDKRINKNKNRRGKKKELIFKRRASNQ